MIHLYFSVGEALHIITARTRPFQSLAADYVPLTSDYEDEVEIVEEGRISLAPSP